MPINVTDLSGFTGTEAWHRWSPLFPKMTLTDGALYVAENGGKHGAFWLMDAIASYQPTLNSKPNLQDFQLWTLEVFPDKTARLVCQADSNLPPEVEQIIEYTDFDLSTFSVYCMPVDGAQTRTILLKSEY